MRYDEASEIVSGLVLSNRIAPNLVRPEQFMPVYDKIIELYKQGNPIEQIIQDVGIEPVRASLDAAKSLNGLGEKNWLQILDESRILFETGTTLEQIGRKMSQGSNVETERVRDALHRLRTGTTSTKALIDIVDEEMPFIKTGWTAWDEHMDGLPEVGMIIIAGNPGSGKTTFMAKLAGCFSKEHPDKNVIIYSAEMIEQEIAGRLRKINKFTEDQERRILINDMSFTPQRVVNDAAMHENVGLVMVDFADYLIEGEITESAMGLLYRTFAVGAKELHCPIVVLAQPSRKYQGGIPRPYHVRYSSLAEILAWMIVMIYNPNTSYFDEEKDDQELAIGIRHINGMDYDLAYAIFWKCRGGFKKHPDESPGAIQFLFKGSRGWSDKGKWYPMKSR